jgi:hypothetical protein
MGQRLLCRNDAAFMPRQISKAGCWIARANENVSGQGNRAPADLA